MGKNNHIEHIDKGYFVRIQELFYSLLIIKDSLKLLKDGKFYQITPIYGQLRAILTDKTQERHNKKKPLLFDIARKFNKKLFLYYTPQETIPEDFPIDKQSIGLKLSNKNISSNKMSPNQENIQLEDYLIEKILYYKNQEYRVHELIDALADKYGGAHYDPNSPKYLTDLISFKINNQSIIDNFIVQIANITFDLSIQLIKNFIDFEFAILLNIQHPFSEENNYLFDFTLPNTVIRISLIHRNYNLIYRIIDQKGIVKSYMIERYFEPNELIYFQSTYFLNSKFQGELKLYINGKEHISDKLEIPLYLINDIHGYLNYFNRSKEKESQNYSFGYDEFVFLGRSLTLAERAGLLEYTYDLINQENYEMFYFEKSAYGFIEPDSNAMKMEGKVQSQKTEPNMDYTPKGYRG